MNYLIAILVGLLLVMLFIHLLPVILAVSVLYILYKHLTKDDK